MINKSHVQSQPISDLVPPHAEIELLMTIAVQPIPTLVQDITSAVPTVLLLVLLGITPTYPLSIEAR